MGRKVSQLCWHRGVKEDYEDDPGFQDHMRKWREWRMRLELEAKGTPTSDTPTPPKPDKPEE